MIRKFAASLLLLLAAQALAAQSSTLDVRHIAIGMTPEQVEAAAKAAGMHRNLALRSAMVEYLDNEATGAATGMGSGYGGKGLILQVEFRSGKAHLIVVQEQGDTMGQVGIDLAKKWGKPKGPNSNPSGAQFEWWGDPKGVWAENFNRSVGEYGVHVEIRAPLTPARPVEGIKM